MSRDNKIRPRSESNALFGLLLLATGFAELPPGADPCGEKGEFHTCVVGGPMFSQRVEVAVGEIVERDGFTFADLIPREGVRAMPKAAGRPDS